MAPPATESAQTPSEVPAGEDPEAEKRNSAPGTGAIAAAAAAAVAARRMGGAVVRGRRRGFAEFSEETQVFGVKSITLLRERCDFVAVANQATNPDRLLGLTSS